LLLALCLLHVSRNEDLREPIHFFRFFGCGPAIHLWLLLFLLSSNSYTISLFFILFLVQSRATSPSSSDSPSRFESGWPNPTPLPLQFPRDLSGRRKCRSLQEQGATHLSFLTSYRRPDAAVPNPIPADSFLSSLSSRSDPHLSSESAGFFFLFPITGPPPSYSLPRERLAAPSFDKRAIFLFYRSSPRTTSLFFFSYGALNSHTTYSGIISLSSS